MTPLSLYAFGCLILHLSFLVVAKGSAFRKLRKSNIYQRDERMTNNGRSMDDGNPEMFESLLNYIDYTFPEANYLMSMTYIPSNNPSYSPSNKPSETPVSSLPSVAPSGILSEAPSGIPLQALSNKPSKTGTTRTPSAVRSDQPSEAPAIDIVTSRPSDALSFSASPSAQDSLIELTRRPSLDTMSSMVPVVQGIPTASPTDGLNPTTLSPALDQTSNPSSSDVTLMPSATLKSDVPSNNPTAVVVTLFPTLSYCLGITESERINQILFQLESVADPTDIRDISTPQGLATSWIINEDEFKMCPDDRRLIQRWTVAVVYYSMGGNNWFECSAESPSCGGRVPFLGDKRFLSEYHECQWAGVSCNTRNRIIEIEFGT